MPALEHGDLTVAIIHHQTPELLHRCLERARPAAPTARILVVDTGEEQPLPPGWRAPVTGVELLRQANHSFAAAVNAALRHSSSELFLHMNADVLVERDTFGRLIAALRTSGAAMAGPLARDASGRLQDQGVGYRRHAWRAQRSGAWVEVPWLSGCLQLLRREAVLRVGGMDATLRFFNEDLEWCLRLRAAGERCILVAHEVTHLGGASTPSSPAFLLEGLRGGYRVTLRHRRPLVRWLHRCAVLGGATLLGFASTDGVRRQAYRQAAAMFRSGNFHESPFGPTLGRPNPLFPGNGPEHRGQQEGRLSR